MTDKQFAKVRNSITFFLRRPLIEKTINDAKASVSSFLAFEDFFNDRTYWDFALLMIATADFAWDEKIKIEFFEYLIQSLAYLNSDKNDTASFIKLFALEMQNRLKELEAGNFFSDTSGIKYAYSHIMKYTLEVVAEIDDKIWTLED